ncbi:ion channel protein [Arthrobacter caoxuetaonis]|uniref:ion channel protein n=1 Tax=Arthrobacter caoxuetaonis TaxID=2886935 RepID=UPI001D139239|nr:ion channel protein [Arthrobacter caoxuetaonis]MCC3282101.1 ion channel protein [Arthrobacter caoxuetaonis]
MTEPVSEGFLEKNRVRTLAALSVPAVLVGVVSALILFGLDELSYLLQELLWDVLPHAAGIDPDGGWWVFGMLTATGLAVGLIVRYLPGHAGPDSAATEFGGPALPLKVVPTLAAAAVIGLAGGVSLGPENPVIAINTAVLTALLTRLFSRVPDRLIIGLTVAGTVGALFGTPVAAALLFTGMAGSMAGKAALFDKLFLPLVAAGAGAATMILLGGTLLKFSLPDAGGDTDLWDVLAGLVIAPVAAALGLAGVFAFRWAHRLFHRLANPVLFTTLGGALLGLLGVLGGPLTLFKGATESGELLRSTGESFGYLLFLAVVKLAALVVASAAGFRGGRIFPALFTGVAFGLAAAALLPDVPVSVTVSTAVLGLVLAVARDGWLALFVAVIITGDATVTALLCLAVLTAWLVVTNAPHWLADDGGDGVRPRGTA